MGIKFERGPFTQYSALQSAAVLDGTEILPANQAGSVVRITLQSVKDFAAGGAGSVSSAEHISLDSRVSTNSAQMTSADDAVSAAVAALSAQHTSLAASVAGALSAIVANSAQMTSADNAVSAAVAALSTQHTSLAASVANAVSAIAANSAQMTSADNAVSAAVVALSAQHTSLAASVAGALSAIAANSAAHTSLAGSVAGALSAIVANSAQMTSADNAISGAVVVVSAKATSIMSAVSVNSAQMTSADNAISAAVVALSAQHTSLAASVAGALSAIAANSAELTSVKGYGLDNISGVSVPSPADGQVLAWDSAQAQWKAISVATGTGSVTSAEHLSAISLISINSAQMTSADDAISAAVNVVSNAVSALTPMRRVLAQNQIVSATAPVSLSGFTFTCSANVAYSFEMMLFYSSPISLAAPKCILSAPGSPTRFLVEYTNLGAPAASNFYTAINATNVTAVWTTVSAVGTARAILVAGGFYASAASNLQLQVGNAITGSTAGSSITFLAGSYGYVWRIG